MRSMFADLYKEVGLTQAYISIGYWLEEVRQSDYFTLDDMERIRDVFGEEIAYMDCSSGVSANAQNGRTQVKFNYEGIDWNYQDVQPVNIVYGRYLNEADVKGRKKKCGNGYRQRHASLWRGKCCGKDLSHNNLRNNG